VYLFDSQGVYKRCVNIYILAGSGNTDKSLERERCISTYLKHI
jgi:hypothetical protein